VDVPGDLIENRFEHVGGDEADSGLDQAPREKAALAEAVQAVTAAHILGFLGQLEGGARLLGRHEGVGLVKGRVE
jgi:hypothetical protein